MVARLRSWYRRSPKTALALVVGVLCVLALGAVAALAVNAVTFAAGSSAANASTTYTYGGRTGNGETISGVTLTFPVNADISAVTAGSISISTGSSVTAFSKVGNQVSFTCSPVVPDKTTFSIVISGVINPSQPGTYGTSVQWGNGTSNFTYSVTANATAVSGVTASPSPDTAGDPAAYTVGFTLGSQGRLAGTTAVGGNTITVTFPSDTTVPASASVANVTINGTNPATAVTDPVGRTVTLTLAAGQTVASSSAVTVAFNSSFGLANPTTGGSYTLGVTTSAQTGTGTSGSYTITAITNPSLTVAAGTNRPTATVFKTANDVYAVDQIALTAADGDVSVTSIGVRGVDTGGTLATDVSQVRIVLDADNDGVYDTGESVLGSGNFSGGSPVTISLGSNLTVTSGTTANVLVVYTFSAAPTNDALLQSSIQNGDVAVGGAATVNAFATITSASVHIDTAAPTANTADPLDNAVLTGSSKTVSGTASDGSGSGVAGVEVRIQRTSDSWYWNGSNWQSGETWVAAVGTAGWTYTWDWTGYTDDQSTTYTITARATDGVALVGTDATPVTGVKIDNVGPTMVSATAIDATHVDVTFSEDLASGSIAAGDFTIAGLTVSAASLDGTDLTVVHLTTSAQTPSTSYTVSSAAGGITDIYGNLNPNTQTTFSGFLPSPTLSVAQGADAGRPSAEIFRTRGAVQAVDEIVLSAAYGDVTVGQIVVRGLDTAANLTTDVTKVQLFIDDGDGSYDGGDTQLGTDQVFSGAASGSTATFGALAHTITVGSSEDVWIVYTIGAAAVNDDIVGSQLVYANGDITVGGTEVVSDFGVITSASAGQTIHVDAAAPTVDTSDPVTDEVLTGASKTVAGTVSDGSGSGVASVGIRIQRASDSQYWDGSGWTATETWNPSTTLLGGNWTYDWTFSPAVQELGTSYTITARAADNVALTATDATPVTGVKIDNVAPTMSSASAIDATHVDVVFSEDLDGATIVAGDFTIVGLTVSAATLDGTDHTLVHLTTSNQTASQSYTVSSVAGSVADLAGNTNPLTTAGFTGYEVVSSGTLAVSQGGDAGRPTAAEFVARGDVRAVDELVMTASTDVVTVNQIVVRGLDTAANLTTDVTKVQLFIDDGDGVFDGSDTQLGTDQTFSGTTATFGSLAHSMAADDTDKVWIVCTIGAAAVDGDIVGSRVNDGDVTASLGSVDSFTDIVSAASGQTFEVDAAAPTANTTAPLNDAVLTGDSTTISGTAADGTGSGVASVDVKIQRSSDSWYWNGGGWQVGEAWNAATGTTTWDYVWDWTGYADDHSQTYTITARATDSVGLTGTDASPVTGVKIDNVVPAISNASAAVDKNTVTVVFSEELDPATVAANGSDFTVAGLTVSGAVLQADDKTVILTTTDQTPSTSYTVSCAAGNVADAFGNVNVLTTAGFFGYTDGADTEDPTTPTNVAASAGTSPVIATITWDASSDNVGVTGYYIYRSQTSGGTFTKIDSTTLLTYDDESGVPGQEYFYKVSAYDAAGNESVLSAETDGVTATWSQLPHETYSSGTNLCRLCHAPHVAATAAGLMRDTGAAAGELSVCYTCHDGSGASTNIKAGDENSFALASGHSLEDTATPEDLTNTCASCHTPHTDPATSPMLPKTTINGNTVANDMTWCLACHDDSDSWYDGVYPGVAAPTLDATGYPTVGTFPGTTAYQDAANNRHSAIATATPSYPAGDCRYCHSTHRSASDYDMLVADFRPSTAATVADDRVNGTYAALCFVCHDGTADWATAGAVDIKRHATYNGADDTAYSGHRIKTAGGTLPVNSPLPCYDCHAPHGSDPADGNSMLLGSYLGTDLDTSTDAGVRQFCFTCHTTSDTTKGWDSATSTYVGVTGETVEGLERDGSDGSILELPVVMGHNEGDLQSCYACHGSDYSAASSFNVHNPGPGESIGGMDCFACHNYQSMQSNTSYHHYMASDSAAAYPSIADATTVTTSDARRTCLACHVDHDYFMTANVDAAHTDGRAQNLRSSVAVAPSISDGSTYVDFDYNQGVGGGGGVCISCHEVQMTKNQTERKSDTDRGSSTVPVSDVGYNASAHDYFLTGSGTGSEGATFASDSSTFGVNCIKCHNDELTKQFQTGPNKFGLHDSSTVSLLADAGQTSVPTDPEEDLCYLCHSRTIDSGTNNPNGGDTYDYFGTTGDVWGALTDTGLLPWSLNIKGSFEATGIVSAHPVSGDGSTTSRVECANCHNPHKTQADLGFQVGDVAHNPDNTLQSSADGDAIAYYSAATTADETKVNRDYCLACHDGTAPTYVNDGASYVPYDVFIAAAAASGANKSAYIGRSHFNAIAGDTSVGALTIEQECADCHDKHGSTLPKMLGLAQTDDILGTRVVGGGTVTGNNNTVCFGCHSAATTNYPAATRDASGYLMQGTWPGSTTYNTAYVAATHTGSAHLEANGGVGTTLPVYTDGDCKVCHDVHGTQYTYDETRMQFESSNFTLCFDCHDTDGPAARNIKVFYPVSVGGTGTGTGHAILTSAGNLTAGDGLPCYDCHNPHGNQNSAYGLLVITEITAGTPIVIGDAANEIKMSPTEQATANNVRNFCFSCHTTADTGKGWNGTALVAVDAAATFEGISRTTYDDAAGLVLRLPNIGAHREGATTQSCYTCHGNDYSTTGQNVHNPSGGISTGGDDCYTCHGAYQSPMEDDQGAKTGATNGTVFHHVLGASDGSLDGDKAFVGVANYPTSKSDLYCMSCHVDHNLFNSPGRDVAANLRPNLGNAPTAGVNYDWGGASNTGVCTQCHSTSLTKSGAAEKAQDGRTATPIIGDAGYAASAHQYAATSTFASDPTPAFNANCSKCHNDELTKDFQSSTYTFGTHASASQHILSALGGTVGGGLQEEHCYRCHSRTTDGLAGTKKGTAGRDWYNATAMSAASERVYAQFQLTSKHPVEAAGGDSVECESCHNAHVVTSGTTKVTDPDDGYTLYTYTDVTNQPAYCLKCHDGSLPSAFIDGTKYVPYSVTQADTTGNNMSANAARGHWSTTGSISAGERVSCAICHDNHGSQFPKLLGAYDMTDSRNEINGSVLTGNDNGVCYACHSGISTSYPAGEAQREAGTGYLMDGTWPGGAVYSGANGIHEDANMIWPSSAYVGGDCKNCHDVHGTANTYDETVAAFSDTDFTLCFTCHDSDGPAATNIKTYYGVANGGTGGGTGHEIKTGTGNLTAGEGLPCYDCHNPHGSASAYGLQVRDIGDGATEIDVSTADGVRKFCFACHTTSDTTEGWTGSAWTTVGTTAVEGLRRDGSDGSVMKLPAVSGHRFADLQSCYQCHGSDYSGLSTNNVHNPSGGVSAGGTDCYACHAAYQAPMEDGNLSKTGSQRATTYHHVLGDATTYDGDEAFLAGSYPILPDTGNVYCMSCHVDHDKFNSSQAFNLRPDMSTANPAGANTDFNSGSNSGVCTACHATSLTKQSPGTDQKSDGSTAAPKVLAAGFGASAHDYYATSSYGDATTFNANCSKCHNDEQTKDFQTSANKFGTHWSSVRRILSALGGALSDPLQESHCYRCHSRTTDGLAGTKKTVASRDWYNATAMTAASERVYAQFQLASKHPVVAAGGDSVECESCHNAHVVTAGTTKVTDPDNTYNTYTYSSDDNQPAYCLKCHDGTLPSYTVDGTTYIPFAVTQADTASNNMSTYATRGHWSDGTAAGGSISTLERVSCAECHDNHGSAAPKLLGAYDMTDSRNEIAGTQITANDNTVCYACHSTATGTTYTRLANGYPSIGTWPGQAVYTGANGIHKGASVIWPSSTYTGGDCKNCHDVHGTAYTYDELVGQFDPSSAGNDKYALCFNCHDGAPSTKNIKQYYPTSSGGTSSGSNAGHQIKSTESGALLAAGTGLPCYDCHNPHGSAATDGLLVMTEINGTTFAVGDAAGEIDLSSAAGVRRFCFLCHTTATNRGTSSTGLTYSNITANDEVEGLERTEANGPNALKLSALTAHTEANTQSCLTCHGDFTASSATNVHSPSSGAGGGPCNQSGCHGSDSGERLDKMQNDTATYHHVLDGATPFQNTYPTPSQTTLYCLSCHVDHANFNTAAGNLRTSYSDTPSGASGVNSDFPGGGTYGVCISCHSTAQTKNSTGQKTGGSTVTPAITGSGYDASSHDYLINDATKVGYDSDAFRANCIKCHDDGATGVSTRQDGTYKLAPHLSAENRIAQALGAALAGSSTATEEKLCYTCHITAAGSATDTKVTVGRDGYDVAVGMTTRSEAIYALLQKPVKHNVAGYAGIHRSDELTVGGNQFTMAKHVECEDCHDTHSAARGVHTVGTSLASNSIRGATGMDWTAGSTNWSTAGSTLVGIADVTYEYEICLKCHSRANPNLGTWNSNWTDVTLEFNTANESYHPVFGPIKSGRALTADKMQPGWTANLTTMTMYCSDCHMDDASTAAASGPHGSAYPHMLKGTWTGAETLNSAVQAGSTNLCYKCHTLLGSAPNTAHNKGQHQGLPCSNCHILRPHGGKVPRLLATDDALPPYQTGDARLDSFAFPITGTQQCDTTCGNHDKSGTLTYQW